MTSKPDSPLNHTPELAVGDLIDALQQKVKQNPKDIRSLLMLGNSYYMAGKIVRAIEVYKAVLALDPNISHAYYHIGIAYYRNAKLDEAIGALEKAREINPSLVMTFYWLGVSYYHKGLYTQSRQAFEILLEKNQESIIAHYHAALSCIADLAWDRARYHLEVLVKEDHADPQVFLLLGKVYFRLRRIEDSIDIYKKGLAVNPGNQPLQEAVEFLINVQEP
jgi:tetratricopeptide (TPR) repeat protein